MGGPGSGQWYRWNTKPTVGDYRCVDVRDWHRQRLLRPGVGFTTSWSNHQGDQIASVNVRVQDAGVTLCYGYRRGEAPWQNIEQSVSLTWTPCHYGGQRAWFRCPGVMSGRICDRQVAILYAAGRHFLCRQCYHLTYASQREDRGYRAIRRAHKIQERLGGRPGSAYPFPLKPKGMHWRTYHRWQAKAQEAEWESWEAAAERFGLLQA
jgi:hypothetical protein